ncbi:hypothetical protein AU467_06845 [Mesorhizobium loti]|uniref:Uncharacterized protein n=1 Tax=Rhizobium loti TaxID=381 RepID=A0A117N243_RHILI|nr:hypothetical protein AU467_06845 [Mesorhizobium loti]
MLDGPGPASNASSETSRPPSLAQPGLAASVSPVPIPACKKTSHDVDSGVGECRDVGDLGIPGIRKGVAIGSLPMALFHHVDGGEVLLHRAQQTDTPFDLAIVEHERWRGKLPASP